MTYNMSLRMEHNTLQTFVPISFLISFSSEGENGAIKSLTSKPIVNHANFTYNHNVAGQQFNTDDVSIPPVILCNSGILNFTIKKSCSLSNLISVGRIKLS